MTETELLDPERRMTPREVARLARVSDERVYRAIHAHELPVLAYRPDRRTIFKVRRADAVAWMGGLGDEGWT